MSNGYDKASDQELMLAAALSMVVVFILWWVFKPHLQHALLIATYFELRFVEIIEPVVPGLTSETAEQYRKAVARALNMGVGNYQFERIIPAKKLSQLVLMPFIGAGMLWWAWRIYSHAPFTNQGKLNLDQVDLHLSRTYYAGRPVVGRALELRHPIEDPNARFSMKPWEFALNYGCLKIDGADFPANYIEKGIHLIKPTAMELNEMKFDKRVAENAIKKQLGKRFHRAEDVLKFPREKRALIVAFLCSVSVQFEEKFGTKEAGTEEGVEKWLAQYATSFYDYDTLKRKISKGKLIATLPDKERQSFIDSLPPLKRETLDMSNVDEALKWAVKTPRVRKHLETSAYDNVLLVHLLTGLKLCPGKFVWLKWIDRNLYYALHNVGKPRRLFMEGAGANAHAEHELEIENAEPVPQVTNAVDGLHMELRRNKWVIA